MKLYKNKLTNEIFGFELDRSQDHLITSDMIEYTIPEPTAEEISLKEQEQTSQEALAYILSTDWVITKISEAQLFNADAVSALLIKYADIISLREQARLKTL